MRRVLTLLLTCLGATAQAQDAVTLALGASVVAAGGFDGWASRPGVAGRVEAPFYGGQARVALCLSVFEAQDPAGRPDFALVTATLGWTRSLDIGRASLGAGPLVGVTQFRFDDEDGLFSGNLTNETEAVVGASARLDVPVAGRLGAWTEVEAMRVTLAGPRTLALVSAGLRLRLDAPRWVQTVLK